MLNLLDNMELNIFQEHISQLSVLTSKFGQLIWMAKESNFRFGIRPVKNDSEQSHQRQ